MAEYGIQDDGSFKRKHIDDLQESITDGLRRRVGEDIDLEQGSPAKQIVDMLSEELAEQWEAEQENYYTTYYEDSFGEQLDKLIALAGFSRIRRRVATGVVEFSTSTTNTTNTIIPEGRELATEKTDDTPPIPFVTTEDAILSAGDSVVSVPVRGQEPWEADIGERWLGDRTNVAANTITVLVNPISGIDSITNPLPTGDTNEGFIVGRDRETDAELKLRYENSLAEGGVSTVDAIESNVFNADEDIVSVSVEEIRDPDTGYGPEVTVLAPGVTDDRIARAVFESRAGGLKSFGTESGTIKRQDGATKIERFNRATAVTVYIEAMLVTSGTFPSDGFSRVSDRIIRYIGGEASDGVVYPGLEIADDIIFDQVFRRIMEVQGVVEADMKIGTSSTSVGTENIDISNLEAATTGLDEITIQFTDTGQ